MPTESEGTPLPPRDLRAEAVKARARIQKAIDAARASGADTATLEAKLAAIVDAPHCASCGEPASNRLDDAISDNFTTVKNACRAWAFGGTHICTACLWCCKALAFRCALFFARENGVWFVPIRPIPNWPETRPDPLAALLNPPEPPFVAGLPLYGIDHGGEANAERCIWPWTGDAEHPSVRTYPQGPRLFVPTDPLIKIQSKHTALYCEISRSRERYRLQVDDVGDVTVDVALWRRLRVVCDALLIKMRLLGVGAQDARGALLNGRPPARAPIAILSTWRARSEPLRPYVGAPWWPLFTSLLLMPELTEQPKPERAAPLKMAKAPVAKPKAKPAPVVAIVAAPAPVAVPPVAVAAKPIAPKPQLSLF